MTIDFGCSGVHTHLGLISEHMSKWEGRIADELGLTSADVAVIKTKHPLDLELQTYGT